ncbi:MAG: PorP/SprF family type IX secretion system membrane protein [Bacteroidota bacterium]
MRKLLQLSIIILLTTTFFTVSYSQQLPRGSLIEGNRFIWNPAITGSWDYLEANANYIQQWAGFQDAPQLISINGQIPFTAFNMGVGIQLHQEETGPLRETGIQVNYAYHIPMGYAGRLSFGIAANVRQYTYNPTDEIAVDPNDIKLFEQQSNANHINFGAGIYYKSVDVDEWYKSHFFGGIGFFQALPGNLIFDVDNVNVNFERVIHAYALAGYRFDLDNSFIDLAVQADYAASDIVIPRLNAAFEMHETFWAGVAVDGSFSPSIQLGYIFNNGEDWSFRLGAYASTNSVASNVGLGTTYGFTGAFRLE